MFGLRALIVGNATIDRLDSRERIGGSVFYAGMALSQYLDVETYALIAANEFYSSILRSVFTSIGIKTVMLKCDSIPVFQIIKGKARGIESRGCVIPLEAILSYARLYRPDILLLMPVFREVEPHYIEVVKREINAVIAVDIQGFVRDAKSEGMKSELVCVWRNDMFDALRSADVVHGNISEFCFDNDPKNVLRELANRYVNTESVIIASMDYRGAYVISHGHVYALPAPSVEAHDDVGCGDILTAVTAYFLAQGYSVLDAVARGIAAASLKAERPYSEWFDRELLEIYTKSVLENAIKMKNL